MATPKVKKAAAVAVAPKSNLFRDLSAIFLVNSATFAKATPVEQTEVLIKVNGKPVLFVDDFVSLSNRKQLRDKLLAGSDVSMELEFNDITLDATELAALSALSAVAPVLAKIDAIRSSYPWLDMVDLPEATRCLDGAVERGGYSLSIDAAKQAWDRASKYWGTVADKAPSGFEIYTGYSYGYRSLYTRAEGIKIGCQSIGRAEVEAIARYYGWEPNVA